MSLAGPSEANKEQPTIFTETYTIRFEHCDPAGIVFYPRYFEIIAHVVELWLEKGLGVSAATLIYERKIGLPTVQISCEFPNPSRLEEVLTITLQVERIGTSSFSLNLTATCQGEVRFIARPMLVLIDQEKGKSIPIPDDIRAGMERYLASPESENS